MEMFTISLPSYDFSLSFDYMRFTQRFPDSFITRALDLTHETDISLSNSIITPEVLRLLQQILSTGEYPYVPDIHHQIRTALDYLIIDLPDIIFYPQYQQLLNEYPEFVSQEELDNPDNYQTLLHIARELQFPELATYLFDHTNPDDYKLDDWLEFQNLILPLPTPVNIQIAIMILQRRNITSYLEDSNNSPGWILDDKSPDLLQAYVKVNPNLINEFDIVDRIINQMMYNPNDYSDYLKMLLSIGSFLDPTTYEGMLYNLFMASYNGDISSLKQLLEKIYLIAPLSLSAYGPLLVFNALIQHHYDIANYLIQWLDENVIPDTDTHNGTTGGGLTSLFDSIYLIPIGLHLKD